MKGMILICSLLLVNCGLKAQVPGGAAYFRYPLNVPARLNANFGEMRPNHFHMGLDLSTEGRENLPVLAPADGYIARMKIETGGFGRAIYLNHPNGTTTLYAHMNRFIPAAETYLKEKQYEQKTWKIDVNVPESLIPVKKGQLIGYSGNTGASQGPHVHFEIRDTRTENCINPLLYDLSLTDVTPPDLYRLAFYDRDKSVYEQQPILVPLVKKEGKYRPAALVQLPFKNAFLAIQATDRMTGIPNPNGIYSAALFKEGKPITGFFMNDIGYDKTRYLNGHIDHVYRMKGGPYLQMLFPPKSYDLGHYQKSSNHDHFDVPLQAETYELQVADAHGNKSYLSFDVQQKPGFLANPAEVSSNRIMPNHYNVMEDADVQFVFSEKTFYDGFVFGWKSLYANGLAELSPVYQTYPDFIPVHNYFTLRLRPNRSMGLINEDRVVIKRNYRGKIELKKAVQERGWFSAQFRDLGFFQLLEDLDPPKVSASFGNGLIVRAGSRILIDVADNNRFIREFNGFAGNQWLMFVPVGNRFVYTVDEHLPVGEHKLSVVVYDEAGNQTIREWNIKRI
jgi:murein DD-endopeptidase MepM/ murein hydrolase activator NlpD